MESKLIIGLGNPGREYENTYHNVGHLFIDALAGKNTFKKGKYFEYLKSDGRIYAKTSTFMNQSGGAVASAKRYFEVKPGEILVVHDDSDIPLGSFKLSFGRGSAGHGGIESIIRSLRTNKFHRLRIGVRPSREIKRTKAGGLVLKKIGIKEKKILQDLFSHPEINGEAHPAARARRNA